MSSGVRGIALLPLVLPAVALAAPTGLDADLAKIRDTKQYFYRETFLGWTADHRAAFRTAVCDSAAGGGRDSYCEIWLCVAKPDDESGPDGTNGECARVSMDDDVDRKKLDVDAAKKTDAAELAKLGPLTPGTAIPTTSFKPVIGKADLTLKRTGKAGAGTITISAFIEPGNRADSVKVTTASTDAGCVVAVGHYRYLGAYEGVPTKTPAFFGVVRCK